MCKRLCFFILLCFSLSLSAQKKEVDSQKGHVWLKGTFKIVDKESGFGGRLTYGSKNNFAFKKEVNGNEVDASSQGSWLQEIWAGPFYNYKISKNSKISFGLFYHPLFWFVDGKGGEYYLQHSIESINNFFHDWKYVTFHYRLIFWQMLPAGNDNSGLALEYESLNRHLVGLIFPVGKFLNVLIEEEIMLKNTADDSDNDGQTEVFNRNFLWLGFDVKPVKELVLSLKYVNVFNNKTDTEIQKIRIMNHHLYFEMAYTLGI
ncbi:MAG: hypothetical protein RBT87_04905 [bacterium]|jgi:hypothetical protein|nr:hypothetical protein [bacterium]